MFTSTNEFILLSSAAQPLRNVCVAWINSSLPEVCFVVWRHTVLYSALCTGLYYTADINRHKQTNTHTDTQSLTPTQIVKQLLILTSGNTLITMPIDSCFSSHCGVSIRLKDSIIIYLATQLIAGNHKELNSYRSAALRYGAFCSLYWSAHKTFRMDGNKTILSQLFQHQHRSIIISCLIIFNCIPAKY